MADNAGEVSLVKAVIQRTEEELTTLEVAWTDFQTRVTGLAIMQPELLGQKVNQMTTTFDRFHSLVTGETAQNEAVSPAERIIMTTRQSAILQKLMDALIEGMS